MRKRKTVLIIAAHPDDELLGCAGTVRKYVEEGWEAVSLILGEGLRSRGKAGVSKIKELKRHALAANAQIGISEVCFEGLPDNSFDSIPLLTIIKKVEKYVARFSPDVIFTHFAKDLNIDHRLTFQAVMTACRPQPGVKHPEIYCFEVPSSTDYGQFSPDNAFSPNTFINIEKEIDLKLKALSNYTTEMRSAPHSRSLAGIKVLAQYRGAMAGLRYAEAFLLIRKIVD